MERLIQVGGKRPREWQVWVESDVIHTRKGLIDGRLTHTTDRPGPSGKEGTKSYIDAETRAIMEAQRKIVRKLEQGYRHDNTECEADQSTDFGSLPKNFSVGKPQLQPEKGSKAEERLHTLIDDDQAIFTMKRDGNFHKLLITPNQGVRLFSRGGDEVTEWFPDLVANVKELELPPRSIIGVELVCTTNGKDDRLCLQSLARSKSERARRIQEEDPDKRPYMITLLPLYWKGGEIIKEWVVEDWIDLLYSEIKKRTRGTDLRIEPIEILYGGFKEAKKECTRRDMEGLVIYDRSAYFGEQAFSWDGAIKRTPCWKWKIIYEDDFIVVFDPDHLLYEHGGDWGRGRIGGLPKNVALHQLNKAGELVWVSDCGSGMTDKVRGEILNDWETKDVGDRRVASIVYTKRSYVSKGDKTNALNEPRFNYWHTDKEPTEVVNPLL